MRNWKVWELYDEHGTLLARGRKKDVINIAYQRYVYKLIFTDQLYRTSESLF